MSYLSGLGKTMFDLLEATSEYEEFDLSSKKFIARNGKLYKTVMTSCAIIAVCVGLPIFLILNEYVGLIFLILGAGMLLLLPTLLSYRCKINNISLEEEYWVVCFKVKKKILWEDIKYKKIRVEKNKSIKLYDGNKKKLISFDGTIVGFNRILKMTKRKSISKIK